MTPYAVLCLRANPFAPVETIAGQQIQFDYAQGPLRPLRDKSHLQYYFDLYTWADREQLGALGDNGRIRAFPARGGQVGTIIVISGVSGSGRTSLEELLLYEIADRSKPSLPIVTDYSVRVTARPAQDAADFAQSFIDTVEERLDTIEDKSDAVKNLLERLRTRVKEWREASTEDNRNAEALFRRLAGPVRNALPDTPIVFRLDATNYMNTSDTWTPICRMLRQLADYVILSLSVKDDASLLRTSLQDNQVRIFWIDAPRIDAEKMKRFLARRLAVQRDGAVPADDELFPFTSDALAALFAGIDTGKVEHPISVAIQKLRGAFDKKFDDVKALLAGQGADPIPSARLRITAEDMRRYFSG